MIFSAQLFETTISDSIGIADKKKNISTPIKLFWTKFNY